MERMLNFLFRLALGCLAAFCSSVLHAQSVNKCVDANGKTVYSQVPCPTGAKASTIKTDIVPPPPKGAATLGSTPEAEFQKRQSARREAEEQAAKGSADGKQAQESCSRARQAMASLELGRVASTNAKGERYFLDETELAAEKARTQSLIGQWCK